MEEEIKNLTKKQLDLLITLNNNLTIKWLAEKRGVSRTSIYKIVDRLKDKGLLKIDNLPSLTNVKTNRKIILTQIGRKILRLNGIEINKNRIRNFCEVCGQHLIVNKHHIDGNRKNNHYLNIINLCPNHHHLIHKGVAKLVEEDGRMIYKIRLPKKLDGMKQ